MEETHVDEATATGGRPQPSHSSTISFGALALALCAATACHVVLVSPAASASTQARSSLEHAERDELASTLAYRRSRSIVVASERRAESLTAELERMRAAEATVRAQLVALGDVPHRVVSRRAGQEIRAVGAGDWMPHGLPESAHGLAGE